MELDIQKVKFVQETTVTIRTSRRRTTIPKKIVETFGLKDKDRIRWILTQDNTVIVTKTKCQLQAPDFSQE